MPSHTYIHQHLHIWAAAIFKETQLFITAFLDTSSRLSTLLLILTLLDLDFEV
jgi:hypothetical protein